MPTCLNCIISILLIIYENHHNPKFHDWFQLNSAIASIFTFLGATGIEALNILSSKFAGLNIFSADYSEEMKKYLFWFGLLNLVIEDIPQFIIQVLIYQ